MTLPLLLGECPSKAGDRYRDFPLSGAIGKRLCEWSGIEPDLEGSRYGRYYWALRSEFDCLNTLERYTEPWDAGAARERIVAYFREEDEVPPRIVCLGRRAAAAMGVPDREPWGAWLPRLPGIAELLGTRIAVLPHPSGRNLLYNDDAMVELARRVLREARNPRRKETR